MKSYKMDIEFEAGGHQSKMHLEYYPAHGEEDFDFNILSVVIDGEKLDEDGVSSFFDRWEEAIISAVRKKAME